LTEYVVVSNAPEMVASAPSMPGMWSALRITWSPTAYVGSVASWIPDGGGPPSGSRSWACASGLEVSVCAWSWVGVDSGAVSSSPVPAQLVRAKAPTAAPRVNRVVRVSLFISAPIVRTHLWTVPLWQRSHGTKVISHCEPSLWPSWNGRMPRKPFIEIYPIGV